MTLFRFSLPPCAGGLAWAQPSARRLPLLACRRLTWRPSAWVRALLCHDAIAVSRFAAASHSHRCLSAVQINQALQSSLCADTTCCTVVVLDAAGAALRPALLWMDMRSAPQVCCRGVCKQMKASHARLGLPWSCTCTPTGTALGYAVTGML